MLSVSVQRVFHAVAARPHIVRLLSALSRCLEVQPRTPPTDAAAPQPRLRGHGGDPACATVHITDEQVGDALIATSDLLSADDDPERGGVTLSSIWEQTLVRLGGGTT